MKKYVAAICMFFCAVLFSFNTLADADSEKIIEEFKTNSLTDTPSLEEELSEGEVEQSTPNSFITAVKEMVAHSQQKWHDLTEKWEASDGVEEVEEKTPPHLEDS